MPNLVKETRHFGIVVEDIQKSLHFYGDLLGLQIMREMDESGNYIDNMLKLPGVKVKTVKLSTPVGVTLVELLEFKSHKEKKTLRKIYDIGASHIAFTVEDIEKCYEILSKNGIEFNAPPQNSPDGYAKITFCKDPDGTPVELVQVIDNK